MLCKEGPDRADLSGMSVLRQRWQRRWQGSAVRKTCSWWYSCSQVVSAHASTAHLCYVQYGVFYSLSVRSSLVYGTDVAGLLRIYSLWTRFGGKFTSRKTRTSRACESHNAQFKLCLRTFSDS